MMMMIMMMMVMQYANSVVKADKVQAVKLTVQLTGC